jgi:hypothetical protein
VRDKKNQQGNLLQHSKCNNASNRRSNNSRNADKSMGASKSMGKDPRAWSPVTVGLTTEETPATAGMPATSWNRAKSRTPVTVTTNKKHLQKHGCQQLAPSLCSIFFWYTTMARKTQHKIQAQMAKKNMIIPLHRC